MADRFFSKLTVAESGCWVWHGALDGHGYGQMRINRKGRLATHVALELAGLPRPGKQFCALHKCDTPACVNPEHLWWGTMRENTRDMMAKGRANQSGLAEGRKPSGGKVPVNCGACGADFLTRRTQAAKNKRNFCSRECCATWQSANFTGAPRGQINGIDPRTDKSDPLWGEA